MPTKPEVFEKQGRDAYLNGRSMSPPAKLKAKASIAAYKRGWRAAQQSDIDAVCEAKEIATAIRKDLQELESDVAMDAEVGATDIGDTLEERGKSHGDYYQDAKTAEALHDMISHNKGWNNLTVDQKHSLKMIMNKTARILSGDPNHHDHWHDIAGYATLVARRLDG